MVKKSGGYVQGSAKGVRVGGAILGGAWMVMALPPLFFESENLGLFPLSPLFLYWIIRPWFMGVWLTDEHVVVKSWYRRYRIPVGEVSSASVAGYLGLISKGVIRWIPFAGAVGTLLITEQSGRRRDFPSTIAKRKAALRLALLVRQHVGIERPRSDVSALE